MGALHNVPAPGSAFFTPAQTPPAGTATASSSHDAGEGKKLPKLFTPLRIRGVEFQNRIWVRRVTPAHTERGLTG